MAQHIVLGAVSTSSSFTDKKELPGESNLKWEAIKGFICIAEAFASTAYNYNAFSQPSLAVAVPLFLFLIVTVFIGMPYMCMDFFIKQYTGKIDLQEALNPLLKSVHSGIITLSAAWSLMHANDLADLILFFTSTLTPVPAWSECTRQISQKYDNECISTKNITILCAKLQPKNEFVYLNTTSAHYNYVKLFRTRDRSGLTKRLFLVALVWITNFFCCTVSDQMLVKLFHLTYVFKNITTILCALFLIGSAGEHINGALKDILNYPNKFSYTMTACSVMYVYGVGIVGVYDFGTLTPYLIVDNAVVMFALTFIAFGFLRSLSVAILQQVVKKCVKRDAENFVTNHYFLFVILPLSADFLYVQRIFTMYLYICLSITNATHIAAITCAISKILHSEFRTVKLIYITGLLCFLGFTLSIPLGMSNEEYYDYYYACLVTMSLLGALKSAIVMYLYGVQKFATDMHFWLGFKPTKYWIITWSVLPALLAIFYFRWGSSQVFSGHFGLSAYGKMLSLFIPAVVLILGLYTIIKYIAVNNLTALFSSAYKYGPPEVEERKRRRNYDEALSLRQCTHNCVLLDDRFDCNHMPIIFKTNFDDNVDVVDISLTNIFESEEMTSKKSRVSEMIDAKDIQN